MGRHCNNLNSVTVNVGVSVPVKMNIKQFKGGDREMLTIKGGNCNCSLIESVVTAFYNKGVVTKLINRYQ